MKWLIFAAVLAAVLLVWRNVVAAAAPTIGQEAPAFSLPDQNGKTVDLASFKGKWVALYFYPRDDTPGCTRQACGFRDDRQALKQMGCEVIGVSVDSSASHAAFAQKFQLPFTLLADDGGETAARYGSLINLGVAKFARRNTFLIDPQGKVARVYLSARASRNSKDVIEDLKRLGAA